MAKYHINPFSGDPKVCTATVKACPWGSVDEHYATEEAARFAYEVKMKEEAHVELLATHARMFDVYAAGVDPAYVERVAARLAEIKEREDEENERQDRLAEEIKTRKKTRTWISYARAAKINVDGVTCPKCDTQVKPDQAAYILDESRYAACDSCEYEFDLYTVNIRVGQSKDTYRAYDAAEVPKMTWYHSTAADDWEDYFQNGGFVAHLGSQQAAFDRRLAEDFHFEVKPEDGFWLYELKVDEEAKIAPEVVPDRNEDYNGDTEVLTKKYEVVRYENKWEDMASISLAAHTDKLKVQSKRFVPAKEALSSLSLYNVAPPNFTEK